MRTRVGYAGGTEENPTYHKLGSHTETIEIDYDPSQVSYEDLLTVFWEAHNPIYRFSPQYMSLILYHNEEQRQQAIDSKVEAEARAGRELVTEIRPYSGFYLAEDYHQKYYLKLQDDLTGELKAIYPDKQDFVNSTAVARANGYVGGFGDPTTLQEDLDSLGLSAEGRERLQKFADSGLKSVCPVS